MAHVNRRIGKSSETANPNADGTGGGVLDAFLHDYFQRSGNVVNVPGAALQGISATGGVISDYTVSNTVYRAHIFTSSGALTVSALSAALPNSIEFVQVAGGGGGAVGGGGGAGGFYSTDPNVPAPTRASAITASVQTYPVVIGAGGKGGGSATTDARGANGGNTVFNSVTLQGGGGAGIPQNDPLGPGLSGGSGGGGSANAAGGPGVKPGGAGAFLSLIHI